MPGLDMTGPRGLGPMTGRGLGRGMGMMDVTGKIGRMNTRANFNVTPSQVVAQIRALLDNIPEVKKASGTIKLKLEGMQEKTLTFKYH